LKVLPLKGHKYNIHDSTNYWQEKRGCCAHVEKQIVTAKKGEDVKSLTLLSPHLLYLVRIVPDPGKGVCADPVNRGAILEGEGPGPPSGDKDRQLSPDRGRGKT
jgi:hypothetical protein